MRKYLFALCLFAFSKFSFSQTWNQLASPTTLDLFTVHIDDSSTTYIGGKAFLKSGNACQTIDSLNLYSAATVKDCHFITKNIGAFLMLSTSATNPILLTTNGGQTWNYKYVNLFGQRIFMLDSLHFYVAGYQSGSFGVVAKTIDGGNTFTYTTVCMRPIFGMHFLDVNTGFVCDQVGNVYKTTDGGINWSAFITGNPVTFNDIRFYNTQIGWVVGTGGKIFRTTNGGTTWTLCNSNVANDIHEMVFINDKQGWAITYDTVIYTIDGGVNWHPQFSDPNPATRFTDISVNKNLEGVLVSSNGFIYGFSCPYNPAIHWDTICAGSSKTIAGQTFSNAGKYTIQTPKQNGCDSVIEINLAVRSLPIPTISKNNNTLTASPFATYQWYKNGVALSGKTQPNLTPTSNGIYTVKVTDIYGCSGLSADFNFTFLGIEENQNFALNISPNPTFDKVKIEVENQFFEIEIYTLQGEKIYTSNVIEHSTELDLQTYPPALYLLKISTKDWQTIRKINKF